MSLTTEQTKRLLELILKASPAPPKQSERAKLSDDSFHAQRHFIDAPARLKAACCTRRAGKSFGDALALFEAALNHPGTSSLYLGLTRESAKRIVWKDCIKVVDRTHNLQSKFNETDLSVTLPNGSVIYVAGADSNEKEMAKLLGQKYQRIVIDEAQSWKQDLRHLVYDILGPATADLNGDIMLTGTPCDIKAGLFFDVVQGREPGWHVAHWTAIDNPFMRENWNAHIQELKAKHPNIEDTPGFRQNYLNEWVTDSSNLVYKFDPNKNRAEITPTLPTPEAWRYLLGVDLGFSPDPSAFVVVAYHPNSPNLYIIDTFKQVGMIISDVVERINYFRRLYKISTIIMDAANKQAVEEIRQRHQVPVEAADKHGKPGFIAIMNDELARGVIKLLPQAQPLEAEWADLVWEDELRRNEDSRCANHLSDAALYVWRYAYSYLSKPVPLRLSEEEKLQSWADKQGQKLKRIAQAKRRGGIR